MELLCKIKLKKWRLIITFCRRCGVILATTGPFVYWESNHVFELSGTRFVCRGCSFVLPVIATRDDGWIGIDYFTLYFKEYDVKLSAYVKNVGVLSSCNHQITSRIYHATFIIGTRSVCTATFGMAITYCRRCGLHFSASEPFLIQEFGHNAIRGGMCFTCGFDFIELPPGGMLSEDLILD